MAAHRIEGFAAYEITMASVAPKLHPYVKSTLVDRVTLTIDFSPIHNSDKDRTDQPSRNRKQDVFIPTKYIKHNACDQADKKVATYKLHLDPLTIGK